MRTGCKHGVRVEKPSAVSLRDGKEEVRGVKLGWKVGGDVRRRDEAMEEPRQGRSEGYVVNMPPRMAEAKETSRGVTTHPYPPLVTKL